MKTVARIAAVVVALLVVAGCGDDGSDSAEDLSGEDRSGICAPFRELLRWSEANPPLNDEGSEGGDSETWMRAAEAQERVAETISTMRDFAPEDLRPAFDSQASAARSRAEYLRDGADEGGYMGNFATREAGENGESTTDEMTEFVERACGETWPVILEPEWPYLT